MDEEITEDEDPENTRQRFRKFGLVQKIVNPNRRSR